jgi:hypothetical protein
MTGKRKPARRQAQGRPSEVEGREPGTNLTPEQQRAAEEFKRLRGVEPFGPFVDLLAARN